MQIVWWPATNASVRLILCASVCLTSATVGCNRHGKINGSIHSVSFVADTFFYVQHDPATTDELLMVRKRGETKGRKLLDLETLAPGKHLSNVEIQPSGDGRYIAIGVSPASDGYSIRVLDVAAAALLPDSISRSFDGDASWSDTNTSFYYRRFQQVANGASRDAVFTNMGSYLHKLGDDSSQDKPIFGPDINKELDLPVVGAVNAFPLPGTSFLLGVQSRSPKELDSFWVNDTQSLGGGWRKVIDHTDAVLFEFSSRRTAFYFITRRKTSSGQLMQFDVAHEDISNAREILPASDLQLTDRNRDGILCAQDALYLYGHRKGGSVLTRLPYDDPTLRAEIELPFAGAIADVSGDSHMPGIVFSLAAEGHPFTVYQYDPLNKRLVDARLMP